MTEELQHTLSSLAESLGITVGELWSWLQGNGIDAYAKAVIASLWVRVAFELLGVVIMLGIAAFLLRSHFVKKKTEMFYDGDLLFAAFVFIVIASSCAFFLLIDGSELAGWMASPEGMVISTILGGRS
jgi:hypothetical protein